MNYVPEKTIYLCLAHMSEEGIEKKYVKEAFDTNWVVPLGPNVSAFENDLKNFVGGKSEVVALSAGTAAVHLALIGCGVKPGDEVLVQAFTFCSILNNRNTILICDSQNLVNLIRHTIESYRNNCLWILTSLLLTINDSLFK